MVINHILHSEDTKAQTKRLWITEWFLTGLLCPLSNIFSLEMEGFACTLKKNTKKTQPKNNKRRRVAFGQRSIMENFSLIRECFGNIWGCKQLIWSWCHWAHSCLSPAITAVDPTMVCPREPGSSSSSGLSQLYSAALALALAEAGKRQWKVLSQPLLSWAAAVNGTIHVLKTRTHLAVLYK